MNDVISGLEGDLRSNGINVESIDPSGEVVELVYLTTFPDVSVNHQEMGRALRTFVEAIEHDEWNPKRVEATVLRHEDDVQGTWHAEAEWFRQYVDYDISGEEFSERVIATLSGDRR
ncbi:hypothetical protein [Halobellus salinisoli]|uniref:hypothetical protein n=1 Tax=Halobellus salinisoli TaxID=3108500 RepID=UPI00300B70A8